ncbi:ATP synthase alpha/beta chain, C-terminal domain protein [Peptostreptococcaceae bacterium AS15]|nr:ATP synthase ab domain protein [[Eubacterium] yurii subsp. margaretiae ATCC 43715]EJP22354.1 ATP synthase alpha/beta chain, C-terminal domain protein [Peptostreptococcaceae bacterium AS15]
MVGLPKITDINGPVVKADNMSIYKVRDMVIVGDMKLIGEIISIDEDVATIQVYEETQGLKVGESIQSTGMPLSVTLGPGIIGNIFDGIQRPLQRIYDMTGDFIAEGIGLISIDKEKIWDVEILARAGDKLTAGQIFATVQETSFINHKVTVPPNISGTVTEVLPSGKYSIDTEVLTLVDENNQTHKLKLYHTWPVRVPRPVKTRMPISKPLITGQRVIDVFFPIAKGGTSALPGGFGTGKTMTQHQLAKWSDADIIVYIGCGERGNEMTDVLEEFPKLIDPRTGKPLMERTILIANTSNMPVAAREASIYTGITIAEYYRDMGYHVAIMADSTSRWAEALREISGRLEEMPAEEGYPAYLPSRIAQFYERAGYVKTLSQNDGSITVIGAVSPPGGDFSEPVTENTKRFVTAFIGLDKNLAYIRHYPAVNYLTSYSGYTAMIKEYYDDNISPELLKLRAKMMTLLSEDDKLNQIVQLVGEDVLPNDQRILIEMAKVLKKGFLQQNAMHEVDSYVPLDKQYKMLQVIDNLYDSAEKAVKKQIALTKIKNDDLFEEVIKMKYNIPNENYDEKFEELNKKIKDYFLKLTENNEQE